MRFVQFLFFRHALGLSKIGTELFMLAEDTAGYGNTTKIVKMDTAGNVIKEFENDC